MYKIAKENLSALFQSIAENQELYLPVEVSGQVNYKAWTPDAKVSLETLKTVKSPKDAFFPQSENLCINSRKESGFCRFHSLLHSCTLRHTLF